MSLKTAHSSIYQQGFTLIEAMVAFLVLAIGILGMAGLLSTGMKSNQNSFLRSQAVVLAEDMADRIRSNVAEDYTLAGGAIDSCVVAASTTACASVADFDVDEWSAQVGELLPGGRFIICIDDTFADGEPDDESCDNGSLTVVKLWWVDNTRSDTNTKWEHHVVVVL